MISLGDHTFFVVREESDYQLQTLFEGSRTTVGRGQAPAGEICFLPEAIRWGRGVVGAAPYEWARWERPVGDAGPYEWVRRERPVGDAGPYEWVRWGRGSVSLRGVH